MGKYEWKQPGEEPVIYDPAKPHPSIVFNPRDKIVYADNKEKWVPYWKLADGSVVAAEQILCMLDDQMVDTKNIDREEGPRSILRGAEARQARRRTRPEEDRPVQEQSGHRSGGPEAGRPDHPEPVPGEPGPVEPVDRQGRSGSGRGRNHAHQASDSEPRGRDHPQRRQAARRVRPARREDLRDSIDREGAARRHARRRNTSASSRRTWRSRSNRPSRIRR